MVQVIWPKTYNFLPKWPPASHLESDIIDNIAIDFVLAEVCDTHFANL